MQILPSIQFTFLDDVQYVNSICASKGSKRTIARSFVNTIVKPLFCRNMEGSYKKQDRGNERRGGGKL